MFAYDQRPISDPKTSVDISKFGNQALLRALNIGRVVAFTGSGVSLNFGQPSWNEIGDRATKLFFALENAILESKHWETVEGSMVGDDEIAFQREFKIHLTELVREIKRLHRTKKNNTLHFISLVETYFEGVDELLEKFNVNRDDDRTRFGADDPNRVSLVQAFKNAYKHTKRGKLVFKDEVFFSNYEYARAVAVSEEEKVHHEKGPMLCDADEIDRPPFSRTEFREAFARRFFSRHRQEELKWGNSSAARLKVLLEETFDKFMNEELHKNFDSLFFSVKSQTNDLFKLDACRALHTRLKVNRFMTLNYDLELERMLFEETRSVPVPDRERFQKFLDRESTTNKTEIPAGHRAELVSGSGRLIRSTSSRTDSLADLFSFGAFPTNFNTSVHHLHGRIDDPENMIVSPKDYQRVYYGSGDQQRSFDEARHAVFTGSDVLLVGIGHSEHDVLKPLRAFLELETDRLDQYGKVYYLTATQFDKMRIKENDDLVEILDAALAMNQNLTQELFQTYEVYVLFTDFIWRSRKNWKKELATLAVARVYLAYHLAWGESKVWDLQEVIKQAQKIFEPKSNCFEDEEQPGIREMKLAAMVLERVGSGVEFKDVEPILEALSSRLQSLALVDHIERVRQEQHDWWNDWSQQTGYRLAIFGRHGYKGDKDNASNLKFVGLEQKANATDPLVWRQTNLIAQIGNKPIFVEDEEKAPQFNNLFARSHDSALEAQKDSLSRSQLKYPAAILRLGLPTGSGKGRLVNFLTSPQPLALVENTARPHWSDNRYCPGREANGKQKHVFPFQFLFHRGQNNDVKISLTENDGVEIVGSFSVHLTFALEFTSIIAGVGRFLQTLLDNFLADQIIEEHIDRSRLDYFRTFAFHKPEMNRELSIAYLRNLLDFLVQVCPPEGWSKRAVLIFSYLDRLSDGNGDAYSPLHREFFRLISGWGREEWYQRLPFDLILINSDARKPIRYLSKERELQDSEERRDNEAETSREQFRNGRKLALENWQELKNPAPAVIVDEAMSFVICSNWKEAKGKFQKIGIKDLNPEIIQGEIFKSLKVDPVTNKIETVPDNLHSFVNRRVMFGFCMAALAYELWQNVSLVSKTTVSADFREQELRKRWKQVTIDLSIAINQTGTTGFISELMRVYRGLDQDVASHSSELQLYRDQASLDSVERERLAALVVNHLALFDYLIPSSVLLCCPEIRSMDGIWKLPSHGRKKDHKHLGKTRTKTEVAKILVGLVRRGLASAYWEYEHMIQCGPGEKPPELTADNVNHFVFALDKKVADSIRAETRLSVYGQFKEVPFQTSLYIAQAENPVKPELVHYKMVRKIVREIVRVTHLKMLEHEKSIPDDKKNVGDDDSAEKKFTNEEFQELVRKFKKYSALLRAAYALIRGTFSVAVVSRLRDSWENQHQSKPFDEYRTWIRKLLNSAILFNELMGRIQRAEVDDPKPSDQRKRALLVNQPFFRDEVTWLYNERALVSFVQGRLFDSMPLFDLAIKTTQYSSKADEPVSYGAGQRRISLNLALSRLERGHIRKAEATFNDIMARTDRRWHSDTPSWMNTFAKGYKGLCLHLCDDLEGAERLYCEAIEELTDSGQLRAQSIFRRHYADLLRARSIQAKDESFEEALHQLNSAEQMAESIQAVDLQHYSLIARARLQRDMKKRPEALRNLRQAENYARTMGLQKMLAEVLKVRGEVLLAEGEATQAGFVTAQSVAMSKRNGMRLRKISATIVQAKILNIRGQTDDARRLLHETLLEAQTYDYAIKTSAASNLLNKI